MPIYNAVPSKQQWKNDLGLSTSLGNYKSPFPAMERLGKLIAAYHEVPGVGPARRIGQIHLVYLMYMTCQFIVKNNQKGTTYAKDKMGGKLNTAQFDAVFALEMYLESELLDFLTCELFELPTVLVNTFGREVIHEGQVEDAPFVKANAMDWYRSDVARQTYKLSFRSGLAYKWDYIGGGKGKLRTYDTAGFGDVLEHQGSLYVMDRRGRLYVNGRNETGTLKHSSFMAGQAVQCAGGIRFERGKLIWFSSKSGHYRPTVLQLVNMLERLRDYQVNLSKVIVYRENKRQDWPKSPCPDFEPCKALDLLAMRAWPTGVEPQSTHVSR